MKFIKAFFVSAILACLIFYTAVAFFIDAPVKAEYWVGELILIKKELVKKYVGQPKIIIAGGSSTLFGIDAEYASKSLDMPVINFGLHAGLTLEKILQEVSVVVDQGDFLILPLEPKYYECNNKMNSWQVSSIIGWDHGSWEQMSYMEKLEFISLVPPTLLGQMIFADALKTFYPALISDRLATLDHSLVLSKFRTRTTPSVFAYSAYNINSYGDLQKAESSNFNNQNDDISKPNHVCDKTASKLIRFIDQMKERDVKVFFANTPYITSHNNLDTLKNSELNFRNQFAKIGCFIDKREDLIFDKKYFFNGKLHLNTDGRFLRTKAFIQSIRKNVLSGPCSLNNDMT